MGARLYMRYGSGRECFICGKPITKKERQINFRGWNASAIIHNEPYQCDTKERWFSEKKESEI